MARGEGMVDEVSISDIRVVGGTLKAIELRSTLSERDYDVMKAFSWLHMLRNNQRPKHWYKAGKNGTSVTFDFIQSQQEADAAIAEFRGYVETVNVKHPDVGLTYETKINTVSE